MRVLVTDGENRSSLAAVRSLGKRGCQVVVTSAELPCIASVSKFCDKSYRVPDAASRCDAYSDAILSIAARECIDIAIPMTDQSVLLLNRVRENFSGKTILACPSPDKLAKLADKNSLFKLAESCFVRIPKTFYLSGPDDLGNLIKKINNYPVVVKPALSKVLDGNVLLSGGVRYASSRAELVHIYSKSRIFQYPSMIQEKIVGPGTGLFTLFEKDRHLSLFSHQRLREKPPSGGVSVVCQSVAVDHEMAEYARRLLSAVGWDGIAMVEFKRDLRDGRPRLMEINGRFWGTLQLAIACGVDFPGILVDKIMGKNPSVTQGEYRVGHRLKWFFGTLDHLLIRMKNSDQANNLSPGMPTKWQAITDFVKIWEKDTSFDVFDRKDINPFLHEARDYVRSAAGIKK